MPLDTREMFARLILCEAGGEGLLGMQAVATVVMNRATVTEGEFSRVNNGGDIRAILLQPGQFNCMFEVIDGVYNYQNIYNLTPTDLEYEIVDWAMGGGRLPGIDNALFYFNPYSDVCPPFFPSKVGVIHNRIGNHCFYIPTNRYKDT